MRSDTVLPAGAWDPAHETDRVLIDFARRHRRRIVLTTERGHELLLEVIPPGDSATRASDTVLRSLKRLYNLGIYPEWWKLEPMTADQWQAIDALIAERDSACRGVVLLGLSADVGHLSQAFAAAAAAQTCRGFTVGRTIFDEPSRAWFAGSIDDAELIVRVRKTYETLIDAWRATRATASTPRAGAGLRP